MYNGKTTSLKTVLWKIMNNKLASELSYDLAAEYILEGIRLIGAPLSLISKVSSPIKIVNYKAALPTDLVELKAIRAMTDKDSIEFDTIPLTTATDPFHGDIACRSNEAESDYEVTYVVESGIIKTSFEEGFVQVAYKALPIDEEGYPLVPDNQKVLLALEYYTLFRYLEPLWTIGKITDKAFNYIDTKKCWYMGAAQADMQLSGYDHVEAMMNTINRLIINTNAQSNFYKGSGIKERFKRYS